MPDSSARQHFPVHHIARPATPCGMNDSVCTRCLGVTFGGVEKAPLLVCFLTPECFDIEIRQYPRLVIMQRAAAAASRLRLATLLRCMSERCSQHVFVRDFALCCILPSTPPSPSFRPFTRQSTSSPPSFGLMILEPSSSLQHGIFPLGIAGETVNKSKRVFTDAAVINTACAMSHLKFPAKYCVS